MQLPSRWVVLLGLCTGLATQASAQLTPASLNDTTVFRAFRAPSILADTQQRPRAISHSDLYYTRLKIHKIGSYLMLPLFAAQYYAGDKLLNDENPAGWVKGTHSALAAGVGVLFGVNTVTGVWNLWESRHDPVGRTRKYLHAALMIGADAGFLWTAQTAGDASFKSEGGNHHRDVALYSIGAAAVSTAMMWLWK